MIGRHHKSIAFSITIFLLLSFKLFSQEYRLFSPDEHTLVKISIGDNIRYSVEYLGIEVFKATDLQMTLEEVLIPGPYPRVLKTESSSVDQIITPVVREKRKEIKEKYNEHIIFFDDEFHITFRAYNEGVAYRFSANMNGNISIISENVNFEFGPDDIIYFPEEKSFFSHNERSYLKSKMSELTQGSFCSLPVLIQDKARINLLITESNLVDYPGMWLQYGGNSKLKSIHPKYPRKEIQTRDRDVKIESSENYIAFTNGERNFPWRIVGIADTDGKLLNNQLSFLLAEPLKIKDTEWIKPGKVAWDWWNALNLYNVDFKPGLNTQTYKYYIDFAHKYGIEYIILDEGWYELGDLFKINPDMDMEELFRYGKAKNVGIILWVVWKTLDDQLAPALDQFVRWGASGIKVDFMQRDDQWMVNYYQKIASEAAARHLLVDFHGAYKPSGLRRAYPNVLTREGVKGLEHNKWSADITPEHNLILPFIRMVAGPMDYTPGATVNVQPDSFKIDFTNPMGMGTRCHQMAMYVIYESPLQMLADSPSNYYRAKEMTEFIADIPTVWDETIVLQARIGEFAVVARKTGDTWYIGAMVNEAQDEFLLDLGFLDAAEYDMESFSDGPEAHKNGIDYKKKFSTISGGAILNVRFSPTGGWVARLVKRK